jgi:hypothetical protein
LLLSGSSSTSEETGYAQKSKYLTYDLERAGHMTDDERNTGALTINGEYKNGSVHYLKITDDNIITSTSFGKSEYNSLSSIAENVDTIKVTGLDSLSTSGSWDWKILLEGGYYTYGRNIGNNTANIEGFYVNGSTVSYGDNKKGVIASLCLQDIAEHDDSASEEIARTHKLTINRDNITSTEYFKDSSNNPTSFKSIGDMARAIDNMSGGGGGSILDNYITVNTSDHTINYPSGYVVVIGNVSISPDIGDIYPTSGTWGESTYESLFGIAEDLQRVIWAEDISYIIEDGKMFVDRGTGAITIQGTNPISNGTVTVSNSDVENSKCWDNDGNYTSLKATINNLYAKIAELENKVAVAEESYNNLKAYTKYLAETLDKSITHQDYIADEANKIIEHNNYLAESMNKMVGYNDYLAEKMNQMVAHQDYLAENINDTISYQNYVAEMLDKSIDYSNMLAEEQNKSIAHNDYLAEKMNQMIEHQDYIVEEVNKMGENLIEETKKEEKVEDKVVEKTVVEESVNTEPVVEETKEEKFDAKAYRDTLTEKLDAIIATAKAQYEEAKRVEAQAIEESKKNVDTKNFALINYLPARLNERWSKLSDERKQEILAEAKMFVINNQASAEYFWNTRDFRDKQIEIQKVDEAVVAQPAPVVENAISDERLNAMKEQIQRRMRRY